MAKLSGILALIVAVTAFLYIESVRRSSLTNKEVQISIPSPAFTLEDRNGARFSSDSLRGKVWTANFFFTTCPAICPVVSKMIQQLQDEFAGNDRVNFVSITVEPETDTVPVLKEYASQYGAIDGVWHTLRGELSEIKRIGETGFKLGIGDEPLEHSTSIAVVDKSGNIRSYIRWTEPGALEEIGKEIRRLLAEK